MGPKITNPAVLRPQVDLAPLLDDLGLTGTQLDEKDDRRQWIASRTLSGTGAKALPASAFALLAKLWPGHFTAKIWLDNSPEVDLLGADRSAELGRLSNATTYELKLRLDKASLLAANGDGSLLTRLFVTEAAFANTCRSPYAAVEEDFFADHPYAHIVCPGAGVDLIGPAIRVTSFDRLDTIAPERDTIEASVQAALEVRRAEINTDLTFARLTPLQLHAEGVGWTELAGKTLARMLAHCTALYTADRVRRGDQAGTVVVQYRGGSGDIDVVLDEKISTADPASIAKSAQDLIEWTYRSEPLGSGRSWSKERLSFVRSVLHERFRTMDASSRSTGIATALVDVSNELDWHWRTFIGGQIEQHNGAVRDFTDTVAAQSLDQAARTAQLTGSVLDAMKAAVATVLGSFIGAALSPSFNATVFRIGLIAYAAYLVFFAGLLGLGSSILQFRTASNTYKSRRTRAVILLDEQRVKKLEDGLIDANRRWYTRAFVGAIILYLAVLTAAAWAVINVPVILRSDEPRVVAKTTVTLSNAQPKKSWTTGGINGTNMLVAALSNPGLSDARLSVTAVGARTNVCNLENPQAGDGLILRNPADSDENYLIIVDNKTKDSVKLRVIEVRGSPGLFKGPRPNGCALLGQQGVDWKRPPWAGT